MEVLNIKTWCEPCAKMKNAMWSLTCRKLMCHCIQHPFLSKISLGWALLELFAYNPVGFQRSKTHIQHYFKRFSSCVHKRVQTDSCWFIEMQTKPELTDSFSIGFFVHVCFFKSAEQTELLTQNLCYGWGCEFA